MAIRSGKGPRPGLGTIVAALTGSQGASSSGYRITGLTMPGVYLDPRHNFVRGTFLYAARIDTLGMAFSSFKEPLTASLNKVIIPSIMENFRAQGRPAWKKLSKKTLYNRLIEGFPRGPILTKTGRLRREAARKNNWVVEDNILKLRTNYFDQKVPYAKFHQMGARIPHVHVSHYLKSEIKTINMNVFGIDDTMHVGMPVQAHTISRLFDESAAALPARPYISLTDAEEVEIYNIFLAFMVTKVEKYWGSGSEGL